MYALRCKMCHNNPRNKVHSYWHTSFTCVATSFSYGEFNAFSVMYSFKFISFKKQKMNDAEELHKESLEILAKLASRTAEKLEEHNVISNYKVTHTLKGKNSETCVNCFQENCNGTCDKENAMLNKGMQTPQKERNQSDPVTPTANLKMLVCAASVLTPATNGQDERRNLFSSCDFKENLCNQQLQDAKTTAETMTTLKYERLEQLLAKGKKGQQLLGRKEKSLGLLCKK